MADNQTPERPDGLGLTDDELAVHRTAFASDALRDMIVVLSGGAGGIGRATAWLFARLGAHVVLVGRNQERLDTLVSNLTGRKLKASAYGADIRDPDAVKALFDAAWKTHGRVDVLINSAGGQFPQPAMRLRSEEHTSELQSQSN